MTQPASPDPSALLLREFLAWLAAAPRPYAETMAAWRTSCPRLPVREDATEAGLVRIRAGPTQGEALVVLTEAGRATLGARPEGAR